jgi:cobyrinic acid a,c-diamide synthase
MLRQVCDDLQLTCYGFLPKSGALEQGSRYLGLDFSERAETKELINLLEQHVDWQGLLQLKGAELTGQQQLKDSEPKDLMAATALPGSHVLVARNAESFSFIYQETLDRFAEPRFFDPEADAPIPADTDLLYLPGGYPEKHLDALVKAVSTRQSIKDYAERGGRIVAECGGMMYLCRKIVTDEGEYPMCGVLPYDITARTADRKLSLGYRRFVLDGREYRGHEFHYTQFLGQVPPSACQVYNAKGEPVTTPVFRHRNVLASYTHLYQI